jgi:hypothetical protein
MGAERIPSWLIALAILLFTYGALYYFNGARFMNKFLGLWFLVVVGVVLLSVVVWYTFDRKPPDQGHVLFEIDDLNR